MRNIIYIITCVLLLSGCRRGADAETVAAALRQEADLVTTEVRIRKIAYYDSSQHEHFQLTDPSTWRVGDRRCIVPVEVWIRYGYDLRQLTLENLRIDNDRQAVVVNLPEAKVIDSGYNHDIDENEIVSIATGLRDPIGHETIEAIRHEAYETVMRQDFQELVGREVRYNAEAVLGTVVRSLGFKELIIEP